MSTPTYIIRDQKKTEYTARTVAEVDAILADLRAKFGPAFKFKIQAVKDDRGAAA